MEVDEFGNPIIQPLVLPEEPGNLSVMQDAIMSPEPTIGTGGIPEINVDTPPLDPAQLVNVAPQPTDHDKLAAAQVILGTQQPETVDRVVGKTSTTTSQQTESQATKDAATDLAQASADSKAAAQMESDAVAKQAEVDAKISQEDNDVISHIETARAHAQEESRANFENTIQEIDNKVQELANFKPDTFWGSKSNADKIASALSIGLGSFGQALLGSGQNVGMALLQRKMDEFDKNQDLVYKTKLQTIQNMKGSLDLKRQLAQDAEKTFDATKLAARAQVQSANAKALAMAKTPQVQAAIAQRQAKVDADIASKQADIAAKYEAKSTSTSERDVIEKVKLTAGMGKDGKPLKLTDSQAKARVALSDVVTANQALKKVDVDKLAQSPAYQTFLRSANNERNFASVPLIGGAMKGIGDSISGTNEEYLAKQDPALAQMNAAITSWTRGVIRYKSGASIATKEEGDERNQYWPSLGDTPEAMKDKAAARAEIEKAMRQAGDL